MTLSVDFDLIIIMVAIAMIIIGYLSGATVEIIRLMKLIVPLIIIYLFSEPISRRIVRSGLVQHLFRKYKIITVIPYVNTLMVILAFVMVYFIIYYLMAIFLYRVEKIVASELVKFKLGQINHYFGGILSLVRLYILLSFLILPFVIMGFTSKQDDFTTRAVLSYTPRFIQSPQLVNDSNHLKSTIENYSYLLELIDLNPVVQDLEQIEETLKEERDLLVNLTKMLTNQQNFPTDDPLRLMVMFQQNPNDFINAANDEETKNKLEALYDRMDPYRGFVLWAEAHQTPTRTRGERLKLFVEGFESIYNHTQDLNMRLSLDDYKQVVVVYHWLTEVVGIHVDNIYNLFSDDNAKRIFDRLLIELDTGGLLDELKSIEHKPLMKKLKNVESFLLFYRDHRVSLEDHPYIPYIYRTIADLLIDSKLMKDSEHSPLAAMYLIDTLTHIGRMNLYFPDNNFDEVLVKIFIPLYGLYEDENGLIKPVNDGTIEKQLDDIERMIRQVRTTELFAQQLSEAIVHAKVYDDSRNETISYVQYLLEKGLYTHDAMSRFAESPYLSESTSEKLEKLLSEMGDSHE